MQSNRRQHALRALAGFSLAALLAGGATMAQAEQVWARVVSSTPINDSTGVRSYNVTYEYNGRTYTTRTDSQPGSRISIDVGGYGVATTSPVAPQPQIVGRNYTSTQPAQPDWNNVTPEPGVVVSSGPAPVYTQPVPVYTQPAPVYYQPAPVYVQPTYVYPQPYAYPPIGLSLNLGYSRGWGGGWHGGRWR